MSISPRSPMFAILLLLLAAAARGSAGWDTAMSASTTPSAQGNAAPGLTAVQVPDGILLRVQNAGASIPSVSILRWADGEAPRAIAATEGKREVLDPTAEYNRIYYYRLEGGSGGAIGVRSDTHREFHCSGLPAVPDALLGVDRTETFVTPRGQRVSFTIGAPKRAIQAFKVLPPCAGKKACSDLRNIMNAIGMAKRAGGGRVQLQAGEYALHPDSPYTQLAIEGASDLILAGAGHRDGIPLTHLVFDASTGGKNDPASMTALGIGGGSRRVIVRDISLDWSKPQAIPGTVVNSGQDQHFVVEDGPYYVPDPKNPPSIIILNSYDFKSRTYIQAPWSRRGYSQANIQFNPGFPDGGYFFVIKGQSIPDGSTAIGITATGTAIRVLGDASDVSFEGVHIYGGGGGGFIFGPNGRGFRISNSKITRKPDQLLKPGERPRLISLRGDSDARNTQGEILIESSEFAYTDDDGFNIVGSMVQGAEGTSVLSASDIQFAFKGYNPFAHKWSAGDTLLLFDPDTLKPLSAAPLRVASREDNFNAQTVVHTFRFKLDSPLPGLLAYQDRPAEKLPYFADPRYASAPYVLRNNCLRDSAGGRFIVQSGPGLIEDNVVANTGSSGIQLSASPNNWSEGPGASNVIVRNNKVIGTGYWLTDYDAKGNLTGLATGWLAGAGISVDAASSTGFQAKGVPNGWLQISGNFIANTPGLGLLVSAANNVTVSDNVIVNANAIPFVKNYDADYCGPKSQGFQKYGANQPWCFARTAARGAIMVTHSEAVQIFNNVTLGTSAGVFLNRKD